MTDISITFEELHHLKNLSGVYSRLIYREFGMTHKERSFLCFGYMCEMSKGFYTLSYIHEDYVSITMRTVIKWNSSLQKKGLVYEWHKKSFNGVTGFPKKMRLTDAGKDLIKTMLKYVLDYDKQKLLDITAQDPRFKKDK